MTKGFLDNIFQFTDDSFDEFEQAIPLMSAEEEKQLTESKIPDELPILPLKNTVLFPGVVIPITVGRDKSLALVKQAYENDKIIGVVSQKNAEVENPTLDDIYKIGTVAQILKLIKMPDGSKSIVIQGKSVFQIDEMTATEPFFVAKVHSFKNIQDMAGIELDAALRSVKETASQIINLSPNIPSEATIAIENINSPTFLLNFISSNLNISVEEKQNILETREFSDRMDNIIRYLNKELQVLNLSEEIRSKVKTDIDQQQRDFYLRQQLKAIEEALGENSEKDEITKLRDRSKRQKISGIGTEGINKTYRPAGTNSVFGS